MRRESKQKRVRERGAGRGLSTSYLEPDQEGSDDEGGISLSAIKSKYKKGGKASKSEYFICLILQSLVCNLFQFVDYFN